MASAPVRPWFCRLVDAFPRPPWGGALAAAGGVGLLQAAGWLAYRLLAADPIPLSVDLLRAMIVYALGLAYIVAAAGWLVVEGARRDVAALGPSLKGTPEERQRRTEAFARFVPSRLHTGSLLAVLVPVLLHLASPGSGGPISDLLEGTLAGFEKIYGLVCQVVFWIVVGAVGSAWLADVHRCCGGSGCIC